VPVPGASLSHGRLLRANGGPRGNPELPAWPEKVDQQHTEKVVGGNRQVALL